MAAAGVDKSFYRWTIPTGVALSVLDPAQRAFICLVPGCQQRSPNQQSAHYHVRTAHRGLTPRTLERNRPLDPEEKKQRKREQVRQAAAQLRARKRQRFEEGRLAALDDEEKEGEGEEVLETLVMGARGGQRLAEEWASEHPVALFCTGGRGGLAVACRAVKVWPGTGQCKVLGQPHASLHRPAQVALWWAEQHGERVAHWLSLRRQQGACTWTHVLGKEHDLLLQLIDPACLIDKAGDSAGAAMAVAAVVVGLGGPGQVKVRPRTAVTGEVSVGGRLLPVASIAQKVRAAFEAGCTRVVLPAKNYDELDTAAWPASLQEYAQRAVVRAVDMLDVLGHFLQGFPSRAEALADDKGHSSSLVVLKSHGGPAANSRRPRPVDGCRLEVGLVPGPGRVVLSSMTMGSDLEENVHLVLAWLRLRRADIVQLMGGEGAEGRWQAVLGALTDGRHGPPWDLHVHFSPAAPPSGYYRNAGRGACVALALLALVYGGDMLRTGDSVVYAPLSSPCGALADVKLGEQLLSSLRDSMGVRRVLVTSRSRRVFETRVIKRRWEGQGIELVEVADMMDALGKMRAHGARASSSSGSTGSVG